MWTIYSHMVQAILKLSRLEADVVEFDEKDTLLSEIVSEAADNVMALCVFERHKAVHR